MTEELIEHIKSKYDFVESITIENGFIYVKMSVQVVFLDELTKTLSFFDDEKDLMYEELKKIAKTYDRL